MCLEQPLRAMVGLVPCTLPTPLRQLHFPRLTPALGPEQTISGVGGRLRLGAPRSPCSCAPCPCESRQPSASCGKEAPPGNDSSDSLNLGRSKSPVAGASSHPPAFPSGVPSSPLSRPVGSRALPDHYSPWLWLQFPSPHPLKKPWRHKHSGSVGGLEPPKGRPSRPHR